MGLPFRGASHSNQEFNDVFYALNLSAERAILFGLLGATTEGGFILVKRRKPKRGQRKGSLHIDKRAQRLLAEPISDGSDDELLTTKQVAEWFLCSEQWLEIGRTKGYGPPFITLANRMVRYQRGGCREYLAARMHNSTKEYV